MSNSINGQRNFYRGISYTLIQIEMGDAFTVRNVSKHGVFSDPYFPAFGLNTERYFVSLHTQSKCGKILTKKNSVFGHFSRSVS